MPKKDSKVNPESPKPKRIRKKTETSSRIAREISLPAYDIRQKETNDNLPICSIPKLQIGSTRICKCSPSHLNCLTAKEWMKSQIGVWQFNYERRDIRNKTLHPATFPISLAKKVIELFTHQGELVIDPFVGSGTTLVAANDCNRNAVGFDLKEDYVNLSKSRLPGFALQESRQEAICADARNIPMYLERESVSLILTSPPYANLLNGKGLNKSRRADLRKNSQYLKVEQYSQDERDLGTLSLEEIVS